jgi:hypothetical protein
MDVKTSALVDDGVAECLSGMFCAFLIFQNVVVFVYIC